MLNLAEPCGRQEKIPFKLLSIIAKWLEITFTDYTFLQWFLVLFRHSQSHFLAVIFV